MQHQFSVISFSLGLCLFATLSWGENQSINVLSTITLQAADPQESDSITSATTKFAHDITDVPFSRSMLSETIIQRQNIQRIDEAIQLVNGVYAQNNYGGGFWDNYSIRGFSSDPNMSATVIRNGLTVNRGLSAPRDIVNIAAIEFLKGPATALYGRGEMGGLVNITAKKPQWQSQGIGYFSADTDQKYRTSFEYTAPINADIAYRFALAHEDQKSFRDHVNSNRWFFSPQLSWKISDQTELYFDSEITHQKGLFDRGISAYHGQILMDRETYTGEPEADQNKVSDQFYQLHLRHRLSDEWMLNSAISYKQGKITGSSNEPRSFEAGGEILNRQRRQRYTHTTDQLIQAELLGQMDTSWAKHEILAGIELGRLVFDQHQYRCDNGRAGQLNGGYSNPKRYCINQININHPQYGHYPKEMGLFSNTHEVQDYVALNLQDHMFFNDQWSIVFGARLDHVKQKLDNYLNNIYSHKSLNEISPRVGLNYKLNDNLSFYSNYGRSFALNTGTDINGHVFAPEKGESYEAGTKYQPADNRLLGLAVFYMKKRNALTTNPNDPSYQYAAGEATSQGVELSFQTKLAEKIDLWFNYTYTHAIITKDTYIAKGTYLNSIPRNNVNLSLNYTLLAQGARSAGIGANAIYVGKRNGTQNDQGNLELPDYTVINLNAYYEPDDRYRYQLNINNVFDKTYYVESYSEMWIQPGDPINASISMQWKF
ncbi:MULTISPECIES: TonB-dependent siderophore receptor [unclassified Acinetobacter]|uniref:TonB-dependent receptor n=1 Tax=unclassified Acinetobacter TaxID=196816 RepID=UPI002934D241|nr:MULTISPECIES: TonB-dependent siderophore receptor [unclassified Acinetobacter]WOE31864.1 TonB-dependent siderophore receptor [Acinetobacter sp. SAAs470]WOE37331.1 TonB-dependent siderophore receptor [Acinetobacter sp. SAAs474]